ncbi:PAS domain S-box protein [Vogesella indigofera]|uniref:PAS domain S-box protein n=1 Tax=Vogesella indigofera TaxID=45465 RepID=UPI0035B0483E
MRNNQPVTGQEYPLDPHRPLVSMTDRKGVILHANPAFISASGFDQDELIGQPHNIIRHPGHLKTCGARRRPISPGGAS